MQAASELLNHKCFRPRGIKSPKKEVTMNQSVAVGLNVYLNYHIDEGFDLSTACILKQGHHYHLGDDVLIYSYFPCLGVAVPLCPGDILIFIALEGHCIRSRVSIDYQLY